MPRGGYYPTQSFGYEPVQSSGYEPTQSFDYSPTDPDAQPVIRRGAKPQPFYRKPKPWPKPRRKHRWVRRISLILALLLLIALVVGGIAAQRVYAFGSAISTQSPFSSQIDLSSPQRINLLVLGFGGGNHPGAYLTDSMLIISLQPQTGQTALISVPRDLWVQIPPNSGQNGKINAAYEYGLYNGYNGEAAGKVAAGDLAARKVSDVTGLPVKYWLTLDFQGFRQLVDALGGVDVTVQHAFTAQYPKNDDPSIDASYITIHFDAGPQHMDGERAIEYARAREVTGGDLAEGTDFARSARQQILIKAIVSEMTQISEWPHLWSALDALQQSLYTNLSILDLYHLVNKLNLNQAKHIGLTNQNVLMDATSDDGQYILLPQGGNWDLIRQYIQQQLAG